MLAIVLFCIECWETCSGCADDGCSFCAAWVTEWSDQGDEESVDLVAEYRIGVDLVTVVGMVDRTTFSLWRSRGKRRMLFL